MLSFSTCFFIYYAKFCQQWNIFKIYQFSPKTVSRSQKINVFDVTIIFFTFKQFLFYMPMNFMLSDDVVEYFIKALLKQSDQMAARFIIFRVNKIESKLILKPWFNNSNRENILIPRRLSQTSNWFGSTSRGCECQESIIISVWAT